MNTINFLEKEEHTLKVAWKAFFNLIEREEIPTPARYAAEFERIKEQEAKETFAELIQKMANVLNQLSKRLREIQHYSIEEIKVALKEEAERVEEYERRMRELERQVQFLRKENFTDALTGLWNRKGLQRFFESEVKPNLLQEDFVLVFMNINNFKHINDTYGHNEGDRVLKHFSNFLRANLKGKDFISRYAGDEFVVILVNITLPEAVQVMKNLRQIPLYLPCNREERLTFSVGMTNIIANDTLESAINRADQAMYKCKKKTQEVEFIRV